MYCTHTEKHMKTYRYTNIYTNKHAYTCKCEYEYVYIYIKSYVIYTYTYVYIYIYIYIHIYACIQHRKASWDWTYKKEEAPVEWFMTPAIQSATPRQLDVAGDPFSPNLGSSDPGTTFGRLIKLY